LRILNAKELARYLREAADRVQKREYDSSNVDYATEIRGAITGPSFSYAEKPSPTCRAIFSYLDAMRFDDLGRISLSRSQEVEETKKLVQKAIRSKSHRKSASTTHGRSSELAAENFAFPLRVRYSQNLFTPKVALTPCLELRDLRRQIEEGATVVQCDPGSLVELRETLLDEYVPVAAIYNETREVLVYAFPYEEFGSIAREDYSTLKRISCRRFHNGLACVGDFTESAAGIFLWKMVQSGLGTEWLRPLPVEGEALGVVSAANAVNEPHLVITGRPANGLLSRGHVLFDTIGGVDSIWILRESNIVLSQLTTLFVAAARAKKQFLQRAGFRGYWLLCQALVQL
jgi:hypothetical protein